jgi:Uma2 family endonuclease
MLLSAKKLPKTAMELFEMLPEGLNCEVINNKLYMSPAPLFEHQDVSDELTSKIRSFVKSKKLGRCVSAPIDVFLDSGNAFQPDIIFIATENLEIIVKGKVRGTPDIVIEVVSPGSKKIDYTSKRNVYEKNKVKEYFIVEPGSKKVTSYYLREEVFVKQPEAKGKLVSKLLKKTFSF